MPLARPIAATNAIEAAAFALSFARNFEGHEIEALFSLEQSLRTVLPNFVKTNEIIFNLTDSTHAEQTQKMSGVIAQSFQENGKQDWVLRASENKIIVNCLKYDSWINVWPKARYILLKTAQCVDSETNGVVNALHQVIDKFVYDERPTYYNIGDVFNPDSLLLTEQAKKSGDMWHLFQGWFEDAPSTIDEKQKILNVVNMSSSLINEKLVATIDHTLQANFSKPIEVKYFVGLQTAENGSEFLNKLFDSLHTMNAELLRNILTKDQVAAIGLTK